LSEIVVSVHALHVPGGQRSHRGCIERRHARSVYELGLARHRTGPRNTKRRELSEAFFLIRVLALFDADNEHGRGHAGRPVSRRAEPSIASSRFAERFE
jgi:hypothetical protein